jgi:hypothetical protein
MALSDVAVPTQISGFRAEQTSGNASADSIGSSTVYVHQVFINNSLNTAASYLKLYDASSPTVGTTAPDFIFPVAGSSVAEFSIHPGGKFTNGIKAAVLTDAGTGGTSAPANDCSYVIMYGSAEAPSAG